MIKIKRCRSYITFFLEEPFRQLIEHGEVFTIRRYHRKQGLVEVRRNKRGQPIGLATVEFVGFVKKENGGFVVVDENGKVISKLDKFVSKSGFGSLESWIGAYQKIYKRPQDYFSFGRLYRVQLVKLYNENLKYSIF